MAGNSWDAAVGYIGQAGIDEIMISQNVCMEIGELAESYENLYALVEDEMTATTTIDGSVYGIPSLEITNQYGRSDPQGLHGTGRLHDRTRT